MWPRPQSFGRALDSALAPGALGLLAADQAGRFAFPWLWLAAALVVLWGTRGWRAALRLAVFALLVLTGMAHLRLAWIARAPAAGIDRATEARLSRAEERARALPAALNTLVRAAAAERSLPGALGGDAPAQARLFGALERLRAEALPEASLLVARAEQRDPVAWAGDIWEDDLLAEVRPVTRTPFIREGAVSTLLVTARPVGTEAARGVVVASVVLATRRNIRNEFLRDFDRVAASDRGIEVHYFDARERSPEGDPFPPLDPALRARQSVLRDDSGRPLLALRATAPSPREIEADEAGAYAAAAGVLAIVALLVWAAHPPGPFRLALAASGARLVLLYTAPHVAGGSALLSPDLFSSPALWPLLRSPLDFLLTSAWIFALCLCVFVPASAAAAGPGSPRRLLPGLALGALAAAAAFRLVQDVVSRTVASLDPIPLVPAPSAAAALQLGTLFVLAGAVLLLASLAAWAGRPRRRAHTLAAAVAGLGLAAGAWMLLPRAPARPPALAVLGLLALAAWAGTAGLAGARRLGGDPSAARAVALAALALPAVSPLWFVALAALGEARTQAQVEREYVPLTLRQPAVREQILRDTCRRLDALDVPETLAGPGRGPASSQLSFALWSATDLAAYGFSSAIEVRDEEGRVRSRFALNLPSLSTDRRPLPADSTWKLSTEAVTVASEERRVLHARRLLEYRGEVLGAIHVEVGEDFWNLPFLAARDPYSVLYRTVARPPPGPRPLALAVWRASDRGLAFSSTGRPPAAAALAPPPPGVPGGRWQLVSAEDRPHRAHVVREGEALYAFTYPLRTPGRFVADLAEAVAAAALWAAASLFALLLVRTVAGRPTVSFASLWLAVQRRFALRLSAAIVLLAVAIVVAMMTAVRGFLASRLQAEAREQALARAAIVKKAVEDFAYYQRGEDVGAEPITDAALVWLGSLVRDDLSVYQDGRLVASSERELFSSGLLPLRLSAHAFRRHVLEGEVSPSAEAVRIGDFSYLVVFVPVQLTRQAPPHVLSITQTSQQQEVASAVADIDRIGRLASVAFLLLGVFLAHSFSRRIAGPVRELTAAAHRIAQGDLGATVVPATRDELRGLVDAFNQMAGDLARQRTDLERSNRLAAWADMARQVAHEVKNPLTPIQLSAEHLQRVYGDPRTDFRSVLETCTATILRQVRTLRGIVTEFSAFARPPRLQRDPVDLGQLAREAALPYRTGLPPDVTLGVREEPGLPTVAADRRLVERAIVNLIENALTAVGEAGVIELAVRRSGPERVEVSVRDSGPGIDADVLPRVFEPYFSTRTAGSGLGLALVRKIAEGHGGGADLESAPGQGTLVSFWLPLGPPEPGPGEPDQKE
jgi:signal transduction histidine kinase